jgi:hypothetical protein
LPAGKYLVKVYVDGESRAAELRFSFPREEDFVGQAEVQSAWADGYGPMTVIDAGKVRK